MAMPIPPSIHATVRALMSHAAAPFVVVGLMPSLVAMPSAAAAQTIQAAERALTYTITNPDAGSPARYGLLFPLGAAAQQTSTDQWLLVFDADLDVDAYQRRLHLCYRTDPAGRMPAHSRCVEQISAEFTVISEPGQDRIAIRPTASIDQNRQIGVWVDLMNPLTPDFYGIDLLLSPQSQSRGRALPVGRWLIRIEQPAMESPGSAD